ncbi:MAG: hypothetical protein ACI9D0_000343 [Bacteroidia bacterium]|jgi:hypothetical protein
MKPFLSTSLITLGAFTLATTTAAAQATITPLPSGFTAYHLSPSGTAVSGEDVSGAARLVAPWNPAGNQITLPGTMTNIGSFAGRMNFDGSIIAGAFEDPNIGAAAPGFWQAGAGSGSTTAQFPPGYADGCSITSTNSSVNWAGTVGGVSAVQGCNLWPLRWDIVNNTYQLLDTSSFIVPTAQPSARVSATSGDGLVSAGWIQTTSRSGAVWDQAGTLSFPYLTVANPTGGGEVFATDFTGESFVGTTFDGPVVASGGALHFPAGEAGLNNSGEGMLDISADGRVAVGAGGGASGPFGSPDTGLIWTAWTGGQNINDLFANYGITLPTGNTINRVPGVSLDGHTFLVQQPPMFFGYGDSFIVTLPNSWGNLGGNSPSGANGIPQLQGFGYLTDGAPARLTLSQAAASSPVFLALSATDNPVPLWGGVLHTTNYFKLVNFNTNAAGGAVLDLTWPTGLAGVTIYSQMATLDFSVPDNVTLTNALSSTGF